jgi:uncharacterized membrane protein
MNELAQVLTVVSAIGAGLVGGVFFAFSTFVMPPLRRLPAPTGLAAMQEINRDAPRSPWFMTALLGTALTCVALGVVASTRFGETSSRLELVGAALYLVVIVTTVAYHVPRNDRLELVDASSSGAADAWRVYLREWIPANHVRTVAGSAAATVLTCALLI